MKRIVLAGALMLGLVACGGDEAGGGSVTPAVPDAYNPEASATESTDTRVPYVGDWVWVARVNDTYQRGVFSITTRGTQTDTAKNGGVGINSLCADANCASTTGTNYAVVLTQLGSAGPRLEAFFGNSTNTGNRVTLADTDGKVTLNAQGRPVIAGVGEYGETTPAQTARVAFVQIDATPDGQHGSVSVTDVLTQAQTAADAVPAQQVQSLPSLDPDFILK